MTNNERIPSTQLKRNAKAKNCYCNEEKRRKATTLHSSHYDIATEIEGPSGIAQAHLQQSAEICNLQQKQQQQQPPEESAANHDFGF